MTTRPILSLYRAFKLKTGIKVALFIKSCLNRLTIALKNHKNHIFHRYSAIISRIPNLIHIKYYFGRSGICWMLSVAQSHRLISIFALVYNAWYNIIGTVGSPGILVGAVAYGKTSRIKQYLVSKYNMASIPDSPIGQTN